MRNLNLFVLAASLALAACENSNGTSDNGSESLINSAVKAEKEIKNATAPAPAPAPAEVVSKINGSSAAPAATPADVKVEIEEIIVEAGKTSDHSEQQVLISNFSRLIPQVTASERAPYIKRFQEALGPSWHVSF